MPTIQINLLALHPAQQSIVEHPARFKVVACGRRFGKSELLKDILVNTSLEDSGPYAYCVPTYKMFSVIWAELKALLKPITQKVNEQERQLTLINGSTIDGWSLDNSDGPRGRKYKQVFIDEAAIIPTLQYAWEHVIMATLADYSGGAFFASTPKGRNFFWQLYQLGLDPLRPEWQSFHFPTSSNPRIAPSEIELAKATIPQSVFEQEYEAVFLEGGGAVFRNLRACLKPLLPIALGPVVMGVDWGRMNDYTVIVVMDAETRQMLAMERFNQVDWAIQRGRIAALVAKWRPTLVLAESNSIGEPNIEALQKEGLPVQPFNTTQSSKAQIIDEYCHGGDFGTMLSILMLPTLMKRRKRQREIDKPIIPQD